MDSTDRELTLIITSYHVIHVFRATLVNGVFPGPLIVANKVRTTMMSRCPHLHLPRATILAFGL